MSKQLTISDEVRDRIPGLTLITGIIEVGIPNKDAISEYLNDSWKKLSKEVAETGYKTHPLIANWRDALIGAGIPVKKFPPSIEAIAKRTLTSSTPFSINPIVDTYNAISMDLVLPFGAYDVDQLEGNLKLRTAQGEEKFVGLGSQEIEYTKDTEIIYSDDSDVLTRQFLWRQAEKGKIHNTTKGFVYVCELLQSMDEEKVEETRHVIDMKMQELLGVENVEIITMM